METTETKKRADKPVFDLLFEDQHRQHPDEVGHPRHHQNVEE